MANYFKSRTITELDRLAKTYKTQLFSSIIKDELINKYEMAEASRDEFLNITTFILNATIKDSKLIDAAETTDSKFFAGKLKKYFEDQLTLQDVIDLKTFVDRYNREQVDNLYTNYYNYIYGIDTIENGIAPDSVFYRLVNTIKDLMDKFIEIALTNENVPSITKSIKKWFGSVDDDEGEPITLETFYNNYFDRSKLIEGIVLLEIISFFNNEEERTVFLGVPSNENLPTTFSFADEFVVIDDENTISYREDEEGVYKRVTTKIQIKDDNSNIIFEIPVKVTEIKGYYNGENDFTIDTSKPSSEIDVFSNITIAGEASDITINGNALTLENLKEVLLSNLFGFIDRIDSIIPIGLGQEDRDFLTKRFNIYFKPTGEGEGIQGLLIDIKEFANLYYNKDIIQDYIQTSQKTATHINSKTYASTFEGTCAKDGQQLLFIDVKNMPIDIEEEKISELFGISSGTDLSTILLTYTVLYKELNPVLRDVSLIDVQEIIFSRLLKKEGGKEKIFARNIGEVSFNSSIDTLYRHYKEEDPLLTLSDELYRYKYYYSNMYAARAMPESSLIGFYIGDNSKDTLFLNNYGYKNQEKVEIANFLEIYRTSREYYYKVLLNKAFVKDPEYSLYEKLMITYIAIERFLNSKIENLRNPDYFTSKDIFNFLESYGLGVLNNEEFNFIIAEKDFKLNIVKYFNDLVRLKGSKDVISILLNVFEVGDITMEIKKFLILEKQYHEYKEAPINSLAKLGDSSIKFIEVPYFSENGTREILNALRTGQDIDYELFISQDEYWNAIDVSETDLLDIGIDVAETKYLGLMLSENVYKKFFLSRYMFSTINYLYDNLRIETSPILYDTNIDTGDLYDTISIYEFMEIIKVLYATVIKLYQQYFEGSEETSEGPFYGIKTPINWDFLIKEDETSPGFLPNTISNYSTIKDRFLKASRRISGEETEPINKFNIFEETVESWINFDEISPTGTNLEYEYKKYNYNSYTEVAKQLKDVLFSTHKTTEGKTDVNNVYSNSGDYVLELFENLNLLRIDDETDLWMYILSTYFDREYNAPLANPTYKPDGQDFNYKDLYYKVIEKIMKLPIDYFDGLMTSKLHPELNHNKKFEELIEVIMENVYRTNTDPLECDTSKIPNAVVSEDELLKTALDYLDPDDPVLMPPATNPEELEAEIEKYTERLLLCLNSLQTIFSSEAYMAFSLSLKAQEQRTLEFVRTAVEVFLSYTTELYYTTYRKTFNTPSETIPFSEDIFHTLETKQLDMVFYDEKLEVELVSEGGD